MANDTPTNINLVEATQFLHETTLSAPRTSSTTVEYNVGEEANEMEDNLPSSQNPGEDEKKELWDIRIDQLRAEQATHLADIVEIEKRFGQLEKRWATKPLQTTTARIKMLLISMRGSDISSELDHEIMRNVGEQMRSVIEGLKLRAKSMEKGNLDGTLQQNSEPNPAPVTSNIEGFMDKLYRILWAVCACTSIALFQTALGSGRWYWCIAAIWMCFYGTYAAVGTIFNVSCQLRVRVPPLSVDWCAGRDRGSVFIRQYTWDDNGDISSSYLHQVRREITSFSQTRGSTEPEKVAQVLQFFRLCIWLLCGSFMMDIFRANETSVSWPAGPITFVWLFGQCFKKVYDELDIGRLRRRRAGERLTV